MQSWRGRSGGCEDEICLGMAIAAIGATADSNAFALDKSARGTNLTQRSATALTGSERPERQHGIALQTANQGLTDRNNPSEPAQIPLDPHCASSFD